MTNVNIRLDGERGVVSFRCNKKLWKTFVSQIKAQGLSVCHVLEPMVYGWLHSNVYISNTIRPLKIENLVVERAVKRVRRYAREVVEEVDEESDEIRCVLCRNPDVVGFYRYLRTGEVVPLCKLCARVYKRNYELVRKVKRVVRGEEAEHG